jgi:hypothetical protein
MGHEVYIARVSHRSRYPNLTIAKQRVLTITNVEECLRSLQDGWRCHSRFSMQDCVCKILRYFCTDCELLIDCRQETPSVPKRRPDPVSFDGDEAPATLIEEVYPI